MERMGNREKDRDREKETETEKKDRQILKYKQ